MVRSSEWAVSVSPGSPRRLIERVFNVAIEVPRRP
jgi:hypothetical protein